MGQELLDEPKIVEGEPLRTRGIVITETIILLTGIVIVFMALLLITLGHKVLIPAMEGEDVSVLLGGALGIFIMIFLFVSPVVYAFNWRRSSKRFDAGLTNFKFEENKWLKVSRIGTYLAVLFYISFALLDLFDGNGINYGGVLLFIGFGFVNVFYVIQTNEQVKAIIKA